MRTTCGMGTLLSCGYDYVANLCRQSFPPYPQIVMRAAAVSLYKHTELPSFHPHLLQSSPASPSTRVQSPGLDTRSLHQGCVSTKSLCPLVAGFHSQVLLPAHVRPSLDTSHTSHVKPNSCRVLPR